MRELFRMDRQNYNPEGKVYRRPSARAIILKDGKVLLNYVSKYNCYEFPGGGIEAGETPECAVQREVAEETGRIVVPESVREFGIVIRRQQDSSDPDGIFGTGRNRSGSNRWQFRSIGIAGLLNGSASRLSSGNCA